MKNTGKCPKCGGEEILRVGPGKGQVLCVGLFQYVTCARYICGACGFVEEWVNDQKGLDTLRAKCPRHVVRKTE